MPNVSFTSKLGKRRILEIQYLLRQEVLSIKELAEKMKEKKETIQPYMLHLRENGYVEIVRSERGPCNALKHFYKWGEKILDWNVKIEQVKKVDQVKARPDPLMAALFGVK